MMLKFGTAAAICVAVLFATPAIAKQQSAIGKGVYCSQGGDNAFIPASRFSAKVRASLRKGQKVNVNIAGYGPVSCVVY